MIFILMATYNGARYLRAQVESLQAQSVRDWLLLISDDGSTDGTPALLSELAAGDARIRLLPFEGKLGATRNFERLMREAPQYAEGPTDADCFFFCDQDDVWLPEKIAQTAAQLEAIQQGDRSIPAMVHTDVRVVDSELQEIAPSLWQMFRISPPLLRTLDELGGHCLATGCTMAFNDAARRLALPIPPEAIMHDAWMTLRVASAGGRIGEVCTQTMLYRQHGANTLGAKDFRTNYVLGKFRHLREIFHDQRVYYRMLRKVGYGSWAKFYFAKVRYYVRYNRQQRLQS